MKIILDLVLWKTLFPVFQDECNYFSASMDDFILFNFVFFFIAQKQVSIENIVNRMKKRECSFKTHLWRAVKMLMVSSTTFDLSLYFHFLEYLTIYILLLTFSTTSGFPLTFDLWVNVNINNISAITAIKVYALLSKNFMHMRP